MQGKGLGEFIAKGHITHVIRPTLAKSIVISRLGELASNKGFRLSPLAPKAKVAQRAPGAGGRMARRGPDGSPGASPPTGAARWRECASLKILQKIKPPIRLKISVGKRPIM